MSSHSKFVVTDPLQSVESGTFSRALLVHEEHCYSRPCPVEIKEEECDLDDSLKVIEITEQVDVQLYVGENGVTYLQDSSGTKWNLENPESFSLDQLSWQQQQEDAKDNFKFVEHCLNCGGEITTGALCYKCNQPRVSLTDISKQFDFSKLNQAKSVNVKNVNKVTVKNIDHLKQVKVVVDVNKGKKAVVRGKVQAGKKKDPNAGQFKPKKVGVEVVYKRFTCIACEDWFLKIEQLCEHMKDHAPPFGCVACSLKLESEKELSIHSIVHNTIRDSKCVGCNKDFQNVKSLRLHSYQHINHKLFPCSKCPKKFTNAVQLNKHQITHGACPYVCDLCHRKFRRSGYLRRHYCPERWNLMRKSKAEAESTNETTTTK